VSRLRVLLLYAETPENLTLSYQRGWPRHMLAHPRLDCEPVDLARRGARARMWTRASRHDAVVLLHSVFSNEPVLRGAALRRVAAMRRPKALFLGNEYKLIPAKMAFADRLGVSLVVSQLSSGIAHELYAQRLGCAVVGIPNTGLDQDVFAPRTARARRTIDLGYRSYDAPYTLGNRERQILAFDVPQALAGRGLALDISLDPQDRLDEAGWAAFLNSCKGQLGSEAGGDYFELTDETRLRVNAYLDAHPEAPFGEVFEQFFRDYPNPVPGRALSGRVVEAAGTKTVQLLIEGEYGGYFEPGVHYIPLRRDLANLDEAVETFLDEPQANEIADAAYEVAQSELTYARLVDRFVDALEEVL
jgi:Glycosyl transferases group 1